MSLEILSAEVAIENLKTNPFASWPSRAGGNDNRVEPLGKPNFSPSFNLNPGEKVFTIGSCFARNVENALLARGFELPARDVLKKDAEFATIGPNILNNYGVPSIWNELNWALNSDEPPLDKCIYEMSQGKFIDIHLNHALRPASHELVLARRRAIHASYREITQCKVLILTLGLAECWFDKQTGVFINTAPRRQLVRQHPGRFELHVLSYSDVLKYLQDAMELLFSKCLPDFRVIITISPVPFGATHRWQDVMVANAYSKSLLRTAAEEITTKYDQVDYLPSYESVTISQRDLTWEDDQVHVKKAVIDLNVGRMVQRYVTSQGDVVETNEEQTRRLADLAPNLLFLELDGRLNTIADNPDALLIFADGCIKLRKPEAAAEALALLPADFVSEQQIWLTAQVAFAARHYDRVLMALAKLPEAFRRRSGYWPMSITANRALGDAEGCRAAIKGWAEISPHSSEPYRVGGVAMGKLKEWREAEYMFRKAFAMAGVGDPAVTLDYSEYLASRGRIMVARNALADFVPQSPGHAARYEELQLKVGSSVKR